MSIKKLWNSLTLDRVKQIAVYYELEIMVLCFIWGLLAIVYWS